MKYFLILFFFIGIISCKKQPDCYVCETPNTIDTICKGDLMYEDIADGKTLTDNVGNVYDCH